MKLRPSLLSRRRRSSHGSRRADEMFVLLGPELVARLVKRPYCGKPACGAVKDGLIDTGCARARGERARILRESENTSRLKVRGKLARRVAPRVRRRARGGPEARRAAAQHAGRPSVRQRARDRARVQDPAADQKPQRARRGGRARGAGASYYARSKTKYGGRELHGGVSRPPIEQRPRAPYSRSDRRVVARLVDVEAVGGCARRAPVRRAFPPRERAAAAAPRRARARLSQYTRIPDAKRYATAATRNARQPATVKSVTSAKPPRSSACGLRRFMP